MKKTIKAKKKKKVYKVSFKILGKTYEQTGDNVTEALNKFEIRNVKGVRGIMIVEHNGVRKERILMPLQATRFFSSHGLGKEIAVKNLSILFQGI